MYAGNSYQIIVVYVCADDVVKHHDWRGIWVPLPWPWDVGRAGATNAFLSGSFKWYDVAVIFNLVLRTE